MGIFLWLEGDPASHPAITAGLLIFAPALPEHMLRGLLTKSCSRVGNSSQPRADLFECFQYCWLLKEPPLFLSLSLLYPPLVAEAVLVFLCPITLILLTQPPGTGSLGLVRSKQPGGASPSLCFHLDSPARRVTTLRRLDSLFHALMLP